MNKLYTVGITLGLMATAAIFAIIGLILAVKPDQEIAYWWLVASSALGVIGILLLCRAQQLESRSRLDCPGLF